MQSHRSHDSGHGDKRTQPHHTVRRLGTNRYREHGNPKTTRRPRGPWREQKHLIQQMDIDDLRDYLLETEY